MYTFTLLFAAVAVSFAHAIKGVSVTKLVLFLLSSLYLLFSCANLFPFLQITTQLRSRRVVLRCGCFSVSPSVTSSILALALFDAYPLLYCFFMARGFLSISTRTVSFGREGYVTKKKTGHLFAPNINQIFFWLISDAVTELLNKVVGMS